MIAILPPLLLPSVRFITTGLLRGFHTDCAGAELGASGTPGP